MLQHRNARSVVFGIAAAVAATAGAVVLVASAFAKQDEGERRGDDDGSVAVQPRLDVSGRMPLEAPPAVGVDFDPSGYIAAGDDRILEAPPIVDVLFNGGTALDYLDALRSKAPEVNIIVMPHVEEVMLPSMELRSVDVPTALALLDGRQQQAGGVWIRLDLDLVQSQQSRDASALAAADDRLPAAVDPWGQPIYVVSAERQDARGPEFAESGVWSLADLVQAGMNEESITTAVSTALDLTRDSADVEVRFHRETGLLLARATGEQVGVIARVVAELRAAAAQRGQPAQTQNELERERAARHEAEENARSLKALVEERSVALVEAQTRLESLDRMVRQMEAQVRDLHEQLMVREARIRSLQDEVSRQSLPGGKAEEDR